jgi:hypothetical protein
MNWNSTQFDEASPITIRAAHVVGRVLKHIPVGAREAGEYRILSLTATSGISPAP